MGVWALTMKEPSGTSAYQGIQTKQEWPNGIKFPIIQVVNLQKGKLKKNGTHNLEEVHVGQKHQTW